MRIRTNPRPRNASGFTWRLIFRTSRGRRTYPTEPLNCQMTFASEVLLTTSPIPVKLTRGNIVEHGPWNIAYERRIYLPAVACIIIFPFRSPKVFVKLVLKCWLRMSLNHGCPPNLYIRCEILYPAAYPSPGNSEKSFRGTLAEA